MTRKPNAVRLLASAAVSFEIREYDLPVEAFSAEAVALAIGLPAPQVFKTLLASGARTGPCFAVVPANAELDLKALARAASDRRMALVPLQEVEPLSGYRRGAVTALGARKAFPAYLDLSALAHDVMGVSAGAQGLQILLAPNDYLAVTGATAARIARPR